MRHPLRRIDAPWRTRICFVLAGDDLRAVAIHRGRAAARTPRRSPRNGTAAGSGARSRSASAGVVRRLTAGARKKIAVRP